MIRKDFGTNKKLFTVYKKPDSSIEIHVFTENKEIRKVIANHLTDGPYFLKHQKEYASSDTAAKIWLAKIVAEYKDIFVSCRVIFILISKESKLNLRNNDRPFIDSGNGLTVQSKHEGKNLLYDFGFVKVGDWAYSQLKEGICFTLDKYKEERVVYAFVVDNICMYIGVCDNTNTTLKDRMRRYQHMVGNGTNKRINLEVKNCLQSGCAVTIWALKPDNQISYKSLNVDLVKGLENPLIRNIKPKWNIKG